jgi:hypothetical protein
LKGGEGDDKDSKRRDVTLVLMEANKSGKEQLYFLNVEYAHKLSTLFHI